MAAQAGSQRPWDASPPDGSVDTYNLWLDRGLPVDNLLTFIRPFTAGLPMKRNAKPIFVYACHEGNYGIFDMLTAG